MLVAKLAINNENNEISFLHHTVPLGTSNKHLDDISRRPYMKIMAGKYMTELGILVEHLEHPHYVIMRLENLGHFHAKMGVPLEAIFTMGIVMQYFFRQVFTRKDMPKHCDEAWYRVRTHTLMLIGFKRGRSFEKNMCSLSNIHPYAKLPLPNISQKPDFGFLPFLAIYQLDRYQNTELMPVWVMTGRGSSKWMPQLESRGFLHSPLPNDR